ncbi:unnamed protein product [Mycena citricolor]|uniref:Uncharacterized protein n=1 Tax=Mycena citricolor TaxID=2018698 RepID=A0AAD2JXR4_9AGAR|nr:unnamed protein product [Mycena citricolor]
MLPMETPSRIWRRIEAIEDMDMDMPSLPSLPGLGGDSDGDDSLNHITRMSSEKDMVDGNQSNISLPMTSTPAAASHRASTIRPTSSTTSSASRFANSIARTSRSSTGRFSSRKSQIDSFDEVSVIPSLPDILPDRGISGHYPSEDDDEASSKDSVPEIYLPPPEDDESDSPHLSLSDALDSLSRTSSPPPLPLVSRDATPRKNYDYSVSLRSEPKVCWMYQCSILVIHPLKPSPFDKFRNVAMRRPPARTPSLSRTASSSSTSSPTHSTPRSNVSGVPRSNPSSPLLATTVPLPRSATASPAIVISRPDSESSESNDSYLKDGDTQSMDITDVHISPARAGASADEESTSEPEPTFSSEGGPTFQVDRSRPESSARSSPGSRTAMPITSPAASSVATPTPGPRARFNLPSDDDPQTPGATTDTGDDVLTPHTRRRSFLLSVINSTARPRMKFPTPHPRRAAPPDETPAGTPVPASRLAALNATPGPGTAFSGVTARAQRRVSHPLAQSFVPSPGTSDSESISGATPWATPSPAHEGASIISTASSHDLTTHHYRANTSFDPAMGFGAGAQHGVGRFNAGKLNTYLHGLNRRLQEENEILVDRVKKLEEQRGIEPTENRRLSSGSAGRRTSLGGTVLGSVEEDRAAEGWLEEKAELEEMVETFKQELNRCETEKTELEGSLETEKRDRAGDKERWKERMKQVESGVAEIVGELEEKLHAAEKQVQTLEEDAAQQAKENERHVSAVEEERDLAAARAEKAERVLESGKELGGELREANERLDKALADLRGANGQIQDLEDAVLQAESKIDQLGRELDEERVISEELRQDLKAAANQDGHLADVEEELRTTKEYVVELEQAAEGAVASIQSLEAQLATGQEELERLTAVEDELAGQIEEAEGGRDRAEELARQMEDALEAAESKMVDDENEVAQLKGRIATLEQERERLRDRSAQGASPGVSEEDLEALEDELDNANREIARLNTLLNQSPARKAIEMAKDARIDMLEKEKEDLLERVKSLRATMTEIGTPSKAFDTSMMSPMRRQVSIRMPKTPVMSWLNQTNADGTISPLVAEISRLQRELDLANQSIDDKLDKLEDAGLGVVELTQRLGDARAKISLLEEEIARLSRKEQRRNHRLERARCQKCLVKVDLRSVIDADESSILGLNATLPSEPPTPPTRTSQALREDLHSANANLAKMKKHWEDERQKLLGEKAVLQDAANRMNGRVRSAEEETKKVVETKAVSDKLRNSAEAELENARRVISELEADLQDREVSPSIFVHRDTRAQREKENILLQLKRTETDMDAVRRQLHNFKQENHEMEAELRSAFSWFLVLLDW